jgi:hypothetical protein
MTGRSLAEENLEALLKDRASCLSPPTQMGHILNRNVPRELKTICTNSLAHARRPFVEIWRLSPRSAGS